MGVQALPPAFLAAALLLCADPVSSAAGPDGARAPGALAHAIAEQTPDAPVLEVVAATPLPAGHGVGSHFGYRISTRTGIRTFHAGTDFLAPRGTPVFAIAGGVVELVAQNTRQTRMGGYGNAVVVRHEDQGVWSFYAHMSSVQVEPGQVIAPGQLLGEVGNTTNGRFPGMVSHLHLEVRRAAPDGGSPFPGPYRRYNVDPESFLSALGVRFDREATEEGDCVHADGVDDARAPLLVVRERQDAPVAVASAEMATGRF
jgi:murein DD-endopeptidase MepM/ murein hydrolase activator NlpD